MSDLDWRIEEGKIKVNDFIYYVAEEVYPNLSQRAGVRRVRDRVSKAYEKGAFGSNASYDPDRKEDARTLLTWACSQKDWQELNDAEGMEYYLYKRGATSMVGSVTGSVSAFAAPTVLEEAVQRLAECERKLAASEKEKQELRVKVARRNKLSGYGKKGGRPKKLKRDRKL